MHGVRVQRGAPKTQWLTHCIISARLKKSTSWTGWTQGWKSSVLIRVSHAKLVFISNGGKLWRQAAGDPCSGSVGSLMSVFLPKRVKVGSQIDAYWGILSLCRHPNFLSRHRTGKDALHGRFLPATRADSCVLCLIIAASPICLFDLYPTKRVIKTKLIRNETAMRNTEVHPSFSSAPNLSSTDLIPFPLISSPTSPHSHVHRTIGALLEKLYKNSEKQHNGILMLHWKTIMCTNKLGAWWIFTILL